MTYISACTDMCISLLYLLPLAVDVGDAELSPIADVDSHSLHSVHSAHTSSHPSTPDMHRTERALCPSCRLSEPMDFVLRQTSSFTSPDACSRHDWARLNVGGRIFATTRCVYVCMCACMHACVCVCVCVCVFGTEATEKGKG